MDFNSTGAMRSPFSPRVRQSLAGRRTIGTPSGKQNQSVFQPEDEHHGEVIYKTPTMTIETYGPPLPVMVTEALTFASGDLSVRLSSCGWCWLVSGRRVLAWPGCANPSEGGPAALGPQAARELTLPQTDLAHKADLVMLFYEDDAQMPSCIGVSPEGVVRYWANVGQEGVYVEVSCELAGQECDRLTEPRPCSPLHLVLATTTCSLVLLSPDVVDGRSTVTCKTMRPPSGWLGGIGRRVSLLFFGSMPAQADTKLVGVVGAKDYIALVAGGGGGPVLQLWGEQLYEHALRRQLLDALPRHYLGDANGLEVMALDVQAEDEQTLALLVAVGTRHAIVLLSIEQAAAPRVVSVRPVCGGPGARLAGSGAVVCAGGIARAGADGPDRPDAHDSLLAARGSLLFSAKHGVVQLRTAGARPTGSVPHPPSAPPAEGSLALFEIDPRSVRALAGDAAARLKTAFLFHVRRDAAACAELLPPAPPPAALDDVLDRAVLAVAAEMLDDMPAGDPRWKASAGPATNISLGRSTALQISAQLQDKKRAFTLFLDFLHATDLWPRLQRVTFEGAGVHTSEALCALAERLAAAIALRQLHVRHDDQLVEGAIQQVVRADEEDEEAGVASALRSGALSAADVCYRRVSRVLRVVCALSAGRPRALLLNHLTAVLGDMQAVRRAWPDQPPPLNARHLLHPLLDMHTRALAACGEMSGMEREELAEAAAALADRLLLEARDHKPFKDIRRDVIRPYVKEGQVERAIVLAEKFKDLELLVQLCVERDDVDKLCEYVEKYGEECACWVWNVRGGGAGRVVRALAGRTVPAALRQWAGSGPRGAARALAAGDHREASHILAQLAHSERDNLGRMTTLASLSKLCSVASGESSERVSALLSLAAQHEAMPAEVAARAQTNRLYTPEELVQMYIDCKSKSLTEYDYKKALDLTDFIQDMELRDELRLRIWCATILRDEWKSCGEDADDLMRNMFFKLVDLVHIMGGDLELVLPPLEDILTAPELAELASDHNFHYLIKYGYECLDTTRNVVLAQ